ncbi:hypothetical protein OC861_006042 [Tilletia horrida]|nr:hypothetical protein OC861_006042 [Tilletia horrida]
MPQTATPDPNKISEAIRDAFQHDSAQALALLCRVIPQLSESSAREMTDLLIRAASEEETSCLAPIRQLGSAGSERPSDLESSKQGVEECTPPAALTDSEDVSKRSPARSTVELAGDFLAEDGGDQDASFDLELSTSAPEPGQRVPSSDQDEGSDASRESPMPSTLTPVSSTPAAKAAKRKSSPFKPSSPFFEDTDDMQAAPVREARVASPSSLLLDPTQASQGLRMSDMMSHLTIQTGQTASIRPERPPREPEAGRQRPMDIDENMEEEDESGSTSMVDDAEVGADGDDDMEQTDVASAGQVAGTNLKAAEASDSASASDSEQTDDDEEDDQQVNHSEHDGDIEGGVAEEDEVEEQAGSDDEAEGSKRASALTLFKKQGAIKYNASSPSKIREQKRKRALKSGKKAAKHIHASDLDDDEDIISSEEGDDAQRSPSKKSRPAGERHSHLAEDTTPPVSPGRGIHTSGRGHHDELTVTPAPTQTYSTLPDGFDVAASILFEIARYAPADPAQIGDWAMLVHAPLEHPSEMGNEDPSARDEHSNLTRHAIDMRRSHWLKVSRWLQEAIDICAFTQAFRRATVLASGSSTGKENLEKAISDFMREEFAQFPDSDAATEPRSFDPKNHATVGVRLLCLTSVLGSFAFLPLLLLSTRFQSFSKVRHLSSTAMSVLSFLLRGGRPDMSNLSPEDLRTAKAAVFTANVVIPYALRWYMASMTAGFERATSSGKRAPYSSLYVAPRAPDADPTIERAYLPQPAVSRQATDEEDPHPLEFGLMSGYGKKRVPVVNPPLSLLGKNYHRTLATTEPQRDRDRRQPMELRKLFGENGIRSDSEHGSDPHRPTVDIVPDRTAFADMYAYGSEYRSVMGIPVGHASFQSMMNAVQGQILLFSADRIQTVPVPTLDHLRARQLAFRENYHLSTTSYTFDPASIREVSDEENEAEENTVDTQLSRA